MYALRRNRLSCSQRRPRPNRFGNIDRSANGASLRDCWLLFLRSLIATQGVVSRDLLQREQACRLDEPPDAPRAHRRDDTSRLTPIDLALDELIEFLRAKLGQRVAVDEEGRRALDL